MLFSFFSTPWDNRSGWLGVKHQITYFPFLLFFLICCILFVFFILALFSPVSFLIVLHSFTLNRSFTVYADHWHCILLCVLGCHWRSVSSHLQRWILTWEPMSSPWFKRTWQNMGWFLLPWLSTSVICTVLAHSLEHQKQEQVQIFKNKKVFMSYFWCAEPFTTKFYVQQVGGGGGLAAYSQGDRTCFYLSPKTKTNTFDSWEKMHT